MPNEILEQIFSYVSQDETSALRAASRVCHRFRDVIKSNSYVHSSVSREIRREQLYHAESIHPSLFPKFFLPCYGCNDVLDSRKFELNFDHSEISNGKGLGGIRARSRRCLQCFFAHYKGLQSRGVGGYTPGKAVILRHLWEPCLICYNFIIPLGQDKASLTCADHADWRRRLLLQRRTIGEANPWRHLERGKLFYKGIQTKFKKIDVFKDRLQKREARRARRQRPRQRRRQAPILQLSIEDILTTVSRSHFLPVYITVHYCSTLKVVQLHFHLLIFSVRNQPVDTNVQYTTELS